LQAASRWTSDRPCWMLSTWYWWTWIQHGVNYLDSKFDTVLMTLFQTLSKVGKWVLLTLLFSICIENINFILFRGLCISSVMSQDQVSCQSTLVSLNANSCQLFGFKSHTLSCWHDEPFCILSRMKSSFSLPWDLFLLFDATKELSPLSVLTGCYIQVNTTNMSSFSANGESQCL
jgi:hypothetical protein